MKIEKKHIIIAIVVAVVAYLLWKRSKSETEGTGTGTGKTTKSDIDAILDAAGAKAALKQYVRNFALSVDKDPKWKQDIMDKADNNDRTYAQQLVLEAIWTKYTDSDGHYTENTPWDVIAAVKNM